MGKIAGVEGRTDDLHGAKICNIRIIPVEVGVNKKDIKLVQGKQVFFRFAAITLK